MPALNFQKQFVPDVKSGKKRQTIRKPRKHPFKKGDTLYLYSGLRTKKAEKIKEVVCIDARKITIPEFGLSLTIHDEKGPIRLYYMDHQDRFAQADGFETWWDMIRWFSKTHGLPFEGVLIEW